MNAPLPDDRIARAADTLDALQRAIEDHVLGQPELVRLTLLGVLAGGHLLIEGRPGLGKTLLASVLAQACGLSFARVACTPDLTPADLERSGWTSANIVLADEIHRAPPKTQSMWLAGMQDHVIDTGGGPRGLPTPQTVIATLVPLDREDVFPLTETQRDRFLFALDVPFPSLEHLRAIGLRSQAPPVVVPRLDRDRLVELQGLVGDIVVTAPIADYAARITMATHPDHDAAPRSVREFVRYGASPRAMQGLIVGGRAHALRHARSWVTEEDLRAVAPAVLRHRLVATFEAQLEGKTPVALVHDVLAALPGPGRAAP